LVDEVLLRISEKPQREMKRILLSPGDADLLGEMGREPFLEIVLCLGDRGTDLVTDLDG
jgi:hypothetical protein